MAVYRRTSRRRSVLILLVLTSITLITLDARGNGGGVTRTVRDAARDSMAPVQDGGRRRALAGRRLVRRRHPQRATSSRRTASCAASWPGARGEAARGARRARARTASSSSSPSLHVRAGSRRCRPRRSIVGLAGELRVDDRARQGNRRRHRGGMPVSRATVSSAASSQASRKRATVLLLTDPTRGSSVRLGKTGERGVVNGRAGSDLLRLDVVEPRRDGQEGRARVTAGLEGSVVPGGHPGRDASMSVKKAPGAIEQTILVRPLVDVGRAVVRPRVLEWPVPGSRAVDPRRSARCCSSSRSSSCRPRCCRTCGSFGVVPDLGLVATVALAVPRGPRARRGLRVRRRPGHGPVPPDPARARRRSSFALTGYLIGILQGALAAQRLVGHPAPRRPRRAPRRAAVHRDRRPRRPGAALRPAVAPGGAALRGSTTPSWPRSCSRSPVCGARAPARVPAERDQRARKW